jgi:hypothetical protein
MPSRGGFFQEKLAVPVTRLPAQAILLGKRTLLAVTSSEVPIGVGLKHIGTLKNFKQSSPGSACGLWNWDRVRGAPLRQVVKLER